jgi:hypothetical protein
MQADGRHKRKAGSQQKLLAALARLQLGKGTHPNHIGVKVRITKEAIAREARLNAATLYRLPDVLNAINAALEANPQPQRIPPAEARRRALIGEIAELERRNALLIAKNERLMDLLAKYDPTLGETVPTNLAAFRENKKNSAS